MHVEHVYTSKATPCIVHDLETARVRGASIVAFARLRVYTIVLVGGVALVAQLVTACTNTDTRKANRFCLSNSGVAVVAQISRTTAEGELYAPSMGKSGRYQHLSSFRDTNALSRASGVRQAVDKSVGKLLLSASTTSRSRKSPTSAQPRCHHHQRSSTSATIDRPRRRGDESRKSSPRRKRQLRGRGGRSGSNLAIPSCTNGWPTHRALRMELSRF